MTKKILASVHPIDIKPAEQPASGPSSAQDQEQLAASAVLIGATPTNASVSQVMANLSNQVYGTAIQGAKA